MVDSFRLAVLGFGCVGLVSVYALGSPPFRAASYHLKDSMNQQLFSAANSLLEDGLQAPARTGSDTIPR